MFARVYGIDVPVLKANSEQTQSEVGTFDVTVLAQDIDRDRVQFSDISLHRNGVTLASGIVLEPPTLELDDKANLQVTIKAYDELGRLTCYRALTDGHFQDQTVVSIVSVLLASSPDWILTDITTMIDPDAKTTIDLRNKESLFAQVAEVVKAVPQLFLRYGGFNASLGKHELHLGFFGAKRTYLIQHEAVTALKLQGNGRRTFNLIEAFSDKSEGERLTLQPALSYPGIVTHPDWAQFPIVIDNGKYVVINNALPKGCAISKSFNMAKTKNDATPATSAEIAEASFALWQQAVRELQKNTVYNTLTASGFSVETPVVSDKVYLRANVQELVFDHVLMTERPLTTYEVAAWYRITKLRQEFMASQRPDQVGIDIDTEAYLYEFEVTDNDYAERIDSEIELYKKVERFDGADKVIPGAGATLKGSASVPITHGVGDPSDAACLPDTAKEYVFPMPPVPVGSTSVLALIVSQSPSGATFTLTQVPALPATPLKACVQTPGGGWTPTGSVTLTALYLFF